MKNERPHYIDRLLERAGTGDSARAVQAYLDAGGSAVISLQSTSRATGNLTQLPLLHHMVFTNAHPHRELRESVRLLNDAGAHINMKNTYGEGAERTALFSAVERQCCTSVLDVLLQAGADPCALTSTGLTALHLAAQTGFAEACTVLVARADTLLETKDAQGRTALVHAAALGHLNAAKALIQLGANINTIDKWRNRTPLFSAVFHQQVDIADCLVKARADVNAVDHEGHGALFAAVHNHSTALLSCFLSTVPTSLSQIMMATVH
jgi:uncharacterized protein